MDNHIYLAHHGIKGMKWGIRRTPEQLGHRQRKKSERALAQELKTINYRASNFARRSVNKAAMSEDLRKYGHNSSVAHAIGDYSDTYDDVKKLDRILSKIADDMDREARADIKLEQGYRKCEEQLRKVDTTRVTAKEIRKLSERGRHKALELAGEDWDWRYDVLSDYYDNGDIVLGKEAAAKNAQWWNEHH